MKWEPDTAHGGFVGSYKDRMGNVWNAHVFERDGVWRYCLVEGTSVACKSKEEACARVEAELKNMDMEPL